MSGQQQYQELRKTHSRHYARRYGDQYERLRFWDSMKLLTPDDQAWINQHLQLARFAAIPEVE